MNFLTADGLSLSHGTKQLFSDISLSIDHKDRIAIVGLNGCGKSSLLHILARTQEPDSGNMSINASITIHMMEQMPDFDPEQVIIDYIFSKFTVPHTAVIRAYELLVDELDSNWSEEKQAELDHLSAEMERLDAWQFEGRLRALLSQFSIHGMHRKMGELSGGMIRKLSLAQAILSEPDLLILDEPTNHLDIDTILWLEDYLSKWNKAFLIVTHDRYFLDAVCNKIWEIDEERLWVYKGSFTNYLEKKQERQEAQRRRSEKIDNILRTELDWMRRSPCARGTKQKARISRIDEMMKIGGLQEQSHAEMSFSGRRLGKKVVDFHKVCFSYVPDVPIIENFTYRFKAGEKIALVGANGAGKTTFINLLLGSLEPHSGLVDRGVNTQCGIFSQTTLEMPEEETVIGYLKRFAEVIELSHGEKLTASQLLERFLFSSQNHYKKIGVLSGGEKRRLQLLTVLIKNPNFLILDEPTNDLDIHTLSVLEEFLLSFKGSLLIVSHDRFFIDRVCDFLIIMEGKGKVSGFPSSYSDYLLYRQKRQRDEWQLQRNEKNERNLREVTPKETAVRKMTYAEKREYESIEELISSLEEQKKQFEEQFSVVTPTELPVLKKEYDDVCSTLEEKYLRWEDLALLAQG